jgi:thiol-disulfide isomerase/thioredoxin
VKASKIALACLGVLMSAPSFAQAHLDLRGLRGHVVYVDIWASWRTPCRQSFPRMKAVESAYGRQGLSVVAMDLDHCGRACAIRHEGVLTT